LLRNIAHEQLLTVAAIIHSPSPQAFAQFDDLLLLGKGGRVIYHGELAAAPEYFASIGFPLPTGVNPADFYMDVASNKVTREGTNEVERFDPEQLFELWNDHSQRYNQDSVNIHIPITQVLQKDNNIFTRTGGMIRDFGYWISDIANEIGATLMGVGRTIVCIKDPVRETPGFFTVFYRSLVRAFLQYFRSPYEFIGELALHLGCGIFIAIAANKEYYLGPLPAQVCATAPLSLQAKCLMPQNDTLRQIGQFFSWGIGFAGIAVGAGTFGNERVVYWREQASGIPALPYYLAKVVADLPRIALAAACFLLSFIIGFNNNESFASLYLTLLALYFWGFSSGYFISAIVSRQLSSLVGVVYALVWAIAFSGVEPSLADAKTHHPAMNILYDISAPRWAISAFYLKEIQSKSYENTSVGINAYGYNGDTYQRDILMIFIVGIGWQVLAFIMLKVLNRSKQK